jgi:hypothetical protein
LRCGLSLIGTLQTKVLYKYDAMDKRIERDVDTDGNGTIDTAEKYGYDRQNIWAVLDINSTFGARYLYGPGVDDVNVRVMSNGAVAWYRRSRGPRKNEI